VRNALKTAAAEPGLGMGLATYNVLGAQAVGIEHNAMAQAQSQAAQAEMLVDSAVRVRAGVVRAMERIGLCWKLRHTQYSSH
jgi:hypothetical protein